MQTAKFSSYNMVLSAHTLTLTHTHTHTIGRFFNPGSFSGTKWRSINSSLELKRCRVHPRLSTASCLRGHTRRRQLWDRGGWVRSIGLQSDGRWAWPSFSNTLAVPRTRRWSRSRCKAYKPHPQSKQSVIPSSCTASIQKGEERLRGS